MFYHETDRAYQILDIHRVVRSPHPRKETVGRKFAALAYRIRGDAKFYCQNQELYAASGSVVYIPSFMDYQISVGQEELIIVHLLCFGHDGEIIEIHDMGESTAGLFEELHRSWETKNAGYQHGCTAILYRILESLQQIDTPSKSPIEEELLPALLYLRENFQNPSLRIPELAQKCHISEVYFRKLYKKAFGISPMEALLDMRFAYACSLLRSGYYPIKQIAKMSGFTDTKYFRTAFGKRYNTTPSAYTASAMRTEKVFP